MDFGLRDWLLLIGPIVVIGVLLHGYWRMRGGRDNLKMSLDKSFVSKPGEDVSPDDDFSLVKAELPNGGARVRKIPEQTSLDLDEDVPVLMEPVEMGGDHSDAQGASAQDEPDDKTPARMRAPEDVAGSPEDSAADPETAPRPVPKQQRPEHYVVVYVTAIDERFQGQRLLESLVELDMQFGEMDIFHRLDADGEPLFSLVNAVEPGTFDLNIMGELSTPAVSLFMRTHELDDPVAAFDQMINVAETLARDLDGEVKDDSRSVMTPQTIEHSRDTIREYCQRHHVI